MSKERPICGFKVPLWIRCVMWLEWEYPLSVPNEMPMSAKCPESARQGPAAALRVTFTKFRIYAHILGCTVLWISSKLMIFLKGSLSGNALRANRNIWNAHNFFTRVTNFHNSRAKRSWIPPEYDMNRWISPVWWRFVYILQFKFWHKPWSIEHKTRWFFSESHIPR